MHLWGPRWNTDIAGRASVPGAGVCKGRLGEAVSPGEVEQSDHADFMWVCSRGGLRCWGSRSWALLPTPRQVIHPLAPTPAPYFLLSPGLLLWSSALVWFHLCVCFLFCCFLCSREASIWLLLLEVVNFLSFKSQDLDLPGSFIHPSLCHCPWALQNLPEQVTVGENDSGPLAPFLMLIPPHKPTGRSPAPHLTPSSPPYTAPH